MKTEKITQVYAKLVRDKIPTIIASQGHSVAFERYPEEEFAKALHAKLSEEIAEYEYAESPEEAVEEIVDIVEVLYAIAETYGIEPYQLDSLLESKRLERGGFEDRIKLTSVTKSIPVADYYAGEIETTDAAADYEDGSL